MQIKKILKKALIFSLAVLFVSTVISISVAEFIVKHFIPQETYKVAQTLGLNIFAESPIIPYTLKKNVDKFLHIAFTREFTHFVSTNSHGTRGHEFTTEKPEDTYRILFLGDSITFGWGVEDNQEYPALVEKYLNSSLNPKGKYKKVEAINAGFTDGNSLDTYYVYYKDVGVKYNPDLVIVDFHPFNDLSDIYYHSWDKIDNNGYPLILSSKTHIVRDGYLISRKKTNWKYEIPIVRNSHLGILLMNALERSVPGLVSQVKKIVGVSEEKEPFTSDEDIQCVLALEQKKCPEVLWPYVDKTKFLFEGIQKIAKNNNQEFLITFMPGPQQVKPLAEKGQQYDALPMEQKLKYLELDKVNPQKYYREFFSKENFPYLDFLPAILAPRKPMELFYNLDGHINRHGHLVVAKEIISYLKKEKADVFSGDIQYEE